MQTPIEQAAEAIAMHNVKLRMIDPEDLGHAVTQEVRLLISQALVRPRQVDK